MTDVADLAEGKLRLDRPADGVARLTIDHPAKRNALDHPILDTLAEQVRALAAEGVRALVLAAEGPVFSAGYDIGQIPKDEFPERAEKLVAHPFTTALEALDATDVVTIAALQGHTIGGGLELALSCDLRVAAAGIKVGMPPAKLGLVYSHTGLRRFLDAIGEPRTRELFLVGRNIPVERALDWGMVNEVVEPEALAEHVVALAAEVAANAPLSLQGNKQVLRALLAAEGDLDPVVEQELVALREACFASEDLFEGVRAFGEKRPAAWQGR